MLTKFGAVRTRNAKMEMVYCLPAELGVPTTTSPLKNLVLDIDYNDALVVIHTSPGAAQLIARLLDSLGKAEGILGTIAGDDTIFITPARTFSVKQLYDAILVLFAQELENPADYRQFDCRYYSSSRPFFNQSVTNPFVNNKLSIYPAVICTFQNWYDLCSCLT